MDHGWMLCTETFASLEAARAAGLSERIAREFVRLEHASPGDAGLRGDSVAAAGSAHDADRLRFMPTPSAPRPIPAPHGTRRSAPPTTRMRARRRRDAELGEVAATPSPRRGGSTSVETTPSPPLVEREPALLMPEDPRIAALLRERFVDVAGAAKP